MLAAFHGEASTRHLATGSFDVHGLSQILRLVSNYGGYLFMQSGAAVVESDPNGGICTDSLPEALVLPGTLCQVLLPLSCLSARQRTTRVHVPSVRPSTPGIPNVSHDIVRVADELGAEALRQIDHASSWEQHCKQLFQKAHDSGAAVLYVDLIRIPRNRQFISYVLRFLRRARLLKGMVVVNASQEIAGSVQSLVGLDTGQVPDPGRDFLALENDLSSAFSRGQLSGGLPLLLPFTSGRDTPESFDLLWVGLSSLSSPSREGVIRVLNHLFHQEGQIVKWDDVSRIGCMHQSSGAAERKTFLRVFHGVCQCNPFLIRRDHDGCSLAVSKWTIHITAAASIEQVFLDHTVPKSQHCPESRYRDFIYSMPWHSEDRRFRKRYYRTWSVLGNPRHLEIAAQHLLRKAYAEVGDSLFRTGAIVSITPSAGLLARRLAKALRVDFWETRSLHDIRAEEWLPDLSDTAVLIVDYVIDTGTLTRQITDHLGERDCPDIVAVLSMLVSRGGSKWSTWGRVRLCHFVLAFYT